MLEDAADFSLLFLSMVPDMGKMSYDTFVRLIKKVKPSADETTLEAVFNLTDKDRSGSIDPLEFFTVIDTVNVEVR